ncbi:g5572 [Coccomyxa viridis]|uniref:G5572 protein n=1 Tax=Coccomyxa viridis TaxID=1274662 RepID=A0ABP1FX44_9CHLO
MLVMTGTNEPLISLIQKDGKAFAEANYLIRLVPSFEAAIRAYQERAAERGQSFEHVVLLEAAVQGWSLATANARDLLSAIIAAEPATDSPGISVSHDGCQAKSDMTFQDFWAAQDVEAKLSNRAAPESPRNKPVGGCTAAGQNVRNQEVQETTDSQRSPSETKTARKRKAKKARQQAARAQLAAQTAEAEGEDRKVSDTVEDKGGPAKQGSSAEAQADEQPPEAA